jgi:hypothetical protein
VVTSTSNRLPEFPLHSVKLGFADDRLVGILADLIAPLGEVKSPEFSGKTGLAWISDICSIE